MVRLRSWSLHGRKITFYLPGMFRIDQRRGAYPGLSITGKRCYLQCAHCRGRLLRRMIDCSTPEQLLKKAFELDKQGFPGCLITGGSTPQGEIPWKPFFPVLKMITSQTSLKVSVHSGLVDEETAEGLGNSNVYRVLIDVVGSAETLSRVHNLDCGLERIEQTLDLLTRKGLNVVPHIVIGIDHGRIIGEYNALRMIKKYEPTQISLVVFMPLPGTPLGKCAPPALKDVAAVILHARDLFMDIPISLGCSRPRGMYSVALERIALDMGLNKMALWNDETLDYAKSLGLDIEFKYTCCAL